MGGNGCESVGRVRGEIVEMNCIIFFYKQKTAYEMLRSLVGSEMCIRDRITSSSKLHTRVWIGRRSCGGVVISDRSRMPIRLCLLYTSDAADDLLCVDLGGRRIIKKNTQRTTDNICTTSSKHLRSIP